MSAQELAGIGSPRRHAPIALLAQARDDADAPHVLALHHVSILVADAERARSFYENVLALQPLERPDLGFPGAWLALGDAQQLHLMQLPNPDSRDGRPEHGGRDYHFALRVADLAPFIERLERAGVAYTRSRSGRASIFFRDPDGNAVELMGG
ncbi:MAG: VOC family protein [Pseudomonadota bacterium]